MSLLMLFFGLVVGAACSVMFYRLAKGIVADYFLSPIFLALITVGIPILAWLFIDDVPWWFLGGAFVGFFGYLLSPKKF